MADTTAPVARVVKQRKRRPESIKAEQDFKAALTKRNAILLESAYLGSKSAHRVRCADGHLCTPRPNDVKQGKSICRTCSIASRKRRPESISAEARFLAALAEQGATLMGSYLGSKRTHQIRCAEGHLASPKAEHVLAGGRACRVCSGRDSDAAWQNFRTRVEELGGAVVEPAWKGSGTPHAVRCKEGHTNHPTPNRVMQGVGICRTCAGRDPRAAEQRLVARLEEFGAAMLDSYRGMLPRTRFRCAEGHEFVSIPAELMQAKNICRVCAGRDAASLLAAFRGNVEAQGGTLLETAWLGVHEPHEIVCAEGHRRHVKPSKIGQGRPICAACSGYTPEVLAARFSEVVEALGGTLLEPYRGAIQPHRIVCSKGHLCTPTPHSLLAGGGLCRFCRGKAWDAFYVVQDDLNDVIKFGITSGDPRPRLGNHERDGFDRVVRVHTSLPGDTAPWLERAIISALRDTREEPVRGREYYHVRALPLVLDLVDNHPAIRIVT
jgi:hypothetical protein